MLPSHGHNLTCKATVPSHQDCALICLPAGVVVPLLYQGVAGDPLARGEGHAGGRVRGVVSPTADEEAVHAVLVSVSRQGWEGAGLARGWDKDFYTGHSTRIIVSP